MNLNTVADARSSADSCSSADRRCICKLLLEHVSDVGVARWQVLLCTFAHALVMWDAVAPTEAWVEAQLPTLLKVPAALQGIPFK